MGLAHTLTLWTAISGGRRNQVSCRVLLGFKLVFKHITLISRTSSSSTTSWKPQHIILFILSHIKSCDLANTRAPHDINNNSHPERPRFNNHHGCWGCSVSARDSCRRRNAYPQRLGGEALNTIPLLLPSPLYLALSLWDATLCGRPIEAVATHTRKYPRCIFCRQHLLIPVFARHPGE